MSVVFGLLISITTYSQQLNLPLGDYFQQQTDFEVNRSNASINTGFKPLLKSQVNSVFNTDSILYQHERREEFFRKHKRNIIWRKLMFEDFVSIEKDHFSLYVNPLLFVEKGMTEVTNNFFINTRGIELKGNIGNKISYYSSFRENQARYRPYIYDWSWDRLVVPGQGAFKKNNNDLSLFDFSSASAYLSYSPKKWLNLQIGQDKYFIGEGHRSMFLSDNAMNYPFIRISATHKSFNYTTLFTEFRDFENSYYDYHTKKHGAFNYLSYNFRNRIEIGLFEGIIYRTTDTTEYVNKFKWDFFIPIIGLRTAENGFASENNLIAGINTKIKISNYIQLYGQTAIDDPIQKKISYQGGLKVFDIFHSKIKGQKLFILAETNFARPRIYSHQNIKFQTWSHYNQELAHPAGSDFKEFYLQLNYTFHNFSVNYNYINLTLNNKNTFSNIYITDEYNYLLSPDPVKIVHNTVDMAYTINPRTGLQAYLSIDLRSYKSTELQSDRFFMFGIRTRLANYRYDF